MTTVPERNWSGNYAYRATALHRPTSLDELRRLVSGAANVRALGSRHSFTAIADASELIALDRMGDAITVDREAGTVTAPAATTYSELAEALNREGLALANMASLPHISLGGAIATATHGAGERLGNLATSVTGLELVTSSGDLLTRRRGEESFAGMVVGLGALGIVTRVTLEVQPFYEAAQVVYERLEWDALLEHFDEIQAAGDSVSVFHRFGEQTEQLWVKRRAPHPAVRTNLRSPRGNAAAPPGAGRRSRQRHATAGRGRPVVRAAGALSLGVHAERRRGDPVRGVRGPQRRGCGREGGSRAGA